MSDGDLLEQDVDVIVNAWNRNLFPRWLLLPRGVSGAIARRAGPAPFRELRRHGVLPLGAAVLTSAGHLPFAGIIHVAGIGLSWRASARSVRLSTENALALARDAGFRSIALPLIGAGTGGLPPETAQRLILETAKESSFSGEVRVIRFVGPGLCPTAPRATSGH